MRVFICSTYGGRPHGGSGAGTGAGHKRWSRGTIFSNVAHQGVGWIAGVSDDAGKVRRVVCSEDSCSPVGEGHAHSRAGGPQKELGRACQSPPEPAGVTDGPLDYWLQAHDEEA